MTKISRALKLEYTHGSCRPAERKLEAAWKGRQKMGIANVKPGESEGPQAMKRCSTALASR